MLKMRKKCECKAICFSGHLCIIELKGYSAFIE